MTSEAERPRTYRGSGVDIDAGNRLVESIKPLARATMRAGVMGGIGGFGGLFDPKAAGFRDPVLVATTDGVGTKLKLAQALDRHDGVGIDLVAMCVNDLVVQGAEPLFFLDYFATGHLEVGVAERVVAGIAEGCRIAGAALLGGETAEMPGFYQPGEYDLAGFSVGAVERDAVLTGAGIAAGDVVLALPSSGVHSNGYSLVRRVVADLGLDLTAPAPFAPQTGLGEALVTPTRIYVQECLAACRTGRVKGMAHITGGGLYENLPRVLPDGLGARLDTAAWRLPPVFGWLCREGGVPPDELARTFNCGLGMMLVVAPGDADAVRTALEGAGETGVVTVGEIVARAAEPRIVIEGIDHWRSGSASAS